MASSHSNAREFAFNDDEFRFLVDFVYQRTGIVLADHKKDMVYSRLARRVRALGLTSFSDYCALIQGDQADSELGNLMNAITTNLTSFFREGHHFDHLRENLFLPMSIKPPANKRLRIWSAGCSSGMEPYSIAMTLQDAMPNLKSWDVKILATDLDTNMLATGDRGSYRLDQLENIPKRFQNAVSIHREKETIQMSDALRAQIAFKQLNLLESWPMKGPFDAIFCRNVVIYFDKPTQKKLFNRFAEIIKPGGWLYVGHSESLHNVCDRFELLGRTVYQRVT